MSLVRRDQVLAAWAELMKRVFLVDVLECERCGGRMKIIAAIHSPDVAVKILKCLDLKRVGIVLPGMSQDVQFSRRGRRKAPVP